MVALMALSLSSTFVSCSDNDDDEPNLAKEIAGAYKGYSVGACNMFSDYLLGDESTATITATKMVPSIWYINPDLEISL